jgi:hypothetical protein
LKISYIKHADIDKEKWDRCIENAHNGLLYAYSYYLDVMSENWDALVMNDYEAVMPLTWNKKFGIAYLRQPAFTQQLGIFGNCIFDNDVTETFMNKALDLFPFAEINLNYSNEYKKATAIKSNFILSLNQSFIEIEKEFRKDFVKNIKNNNLVFSASEDVEKAIRLFKNNYSERIETPEKDYENILHIYNLLKTKKQILVREVSMKDGTLLATGIFLKDSKRVYYIMSATLKEGRDRQANYFLLYHVIKEFSDQNLIFDFEGSEIPSIKLFFKKFGAVEQSYPFVRINHLPFWKKTVKSMYDYYKGRTKKT